MVIVPAALNKAMSMDPQGCVRRTIITSQLSGNGGWVRRRYLRCRYMTDMSYAVPNRLVPTKKPDLSTRILGIDLPFPIAIAPVGVRCSIFIAARNRQTLYLPQVLKIFHEDKEVRLNLSLIFCAPLNHVGRTVGRR